MRKWLLGGLLVLLLAGIAGWLSLNQQQRDIIATMPTNADILFWDQDQRDAAFRALDQLPLIAKSRVIEAGDNVLPLPAGEPLELPLDLDAYMAQQRSAAIVILIDGKVVLERYGLGFGPEGRWTSFSVAKSLTSTLVGAAIRDGKIRSLDDKVSEYIADLRGSEYDDVTIRQLLTMTSGVAWNEDYDDPNSDAAKFNGHEPTPGMDATVSYMRGLRREAPAGTKWLYKTGETNLLGVLVSEATGEPLADYLSRKIWRPFGMQQDASWILGSTGHEIAGCCIQAATRDMARFGLFVLGGGVGVVPEGWFAEAGAQQVATGRPGRGYGYQWWTYDGGAFSAGGIFGQGLFIDPARNMVIASNANWVSATDQPSAEARDAFYRAVQAAVDARNSSEG